MLSTSGTEYNLISLDEIPQYKEEFGRLGRELDRIWNAYLRGQILLVGMITLASLYRIGSSGR